jgi:hypothetical protein
VKRKHWSDKTGNFVHALIVWHSVQGCQMVFSIKIWVSFVDSWNDT